LKVEEEMILQEFGFSSYFILPFLNKLDLTLLFFKAKLELIFLITFELKEYPKLLNRVKGEFHNFYGQNLV